jgi:hypothetical protein
MRAYGTTIPGTIFLVNRGGSIVLGTTDGEEDLFFEIPILSFAATGTQCCPARCPRPDSYLY